MAKGLLTGASLVAVGAVVGGVVGALVASSAPPSDPAAGAEPRATDSRVERVEARLGVLERRVGGGRRVRAEDGSVAASPGRAAGSVSVAEPGAERDTSGVPVWATDPGDGDPGVTADFVRAVREAIGTIRREDAEAAAERTRADARKRTLDEVDKRLRDYRAKLDLTDEQVTAFREAAAAAFDRRKDAEASGAAREELAALDREKERAYREILGSATHRAFRKLEIDRAARPVIVDVANRAGVDKEQRDRIERLLADHIERYVDPETRLRTEDLDDATRQSIVQSLTEANRAAWDRLRNEILTPEQRDRVPVRLR